MTAEINKAVERLTELAGKPHATPVRASVMMCQEDVQLVLSELSRLREENERLERQVKGYQHHLRACEQISGKALGYPWFKDDQKNFPGATEADGVCIGDHVGDTIVEELATRFEAVTRERDEARADLVVIGNASTHAEGKFGGRMSEVDRIFQNITRVSKLHLSGRQSKEGGE